MDLNITFVALAVIVASSIGLAILYYPEIKAKRFRKDNPAAPEQIASADLNVRPFPVNPAAGRNVAHQIMKAETVQEARSLFNDHRATPRPMDSDWATTAILDRLHKEGSDDEFMDLSMELCEDGIDITSPPYIEEELGISRDEGQ